MKKFAILLFTALLAACLLTSALATDVTITGDANMRTGPSLDAKIIRTLKKGTTVTFNGATRYDDRGVAWYSVHYNKRDGWVSSKYAKLSGNGNASASGTVYASKGDSNVRSGPGLGYSSYGTLYEGQSADFLGSIRTDDRGVDWYNIRFKSRSAWVSSKYTTLYSDYDDDYYDDYDDYDYDDDYDDTYYSDYDEDTVYASKGDSNVRSGPGLGYSSYGTLYQGQSADFLGVIRTDDRGVDWYKIRFKNHSAWVSSKYTTLY